MISISKHSSWAVLLLLLPNLGFAEVEVKLSDPESFADIERSSYSKRRAAAFFEQDIKKLFNSLEGEYLKTGHRLAVDITDVDLAGTVEFTTTQPSQRARVLRSAEPVKIVLRYTLRDQNQATLKSGEVTLSDVVNTSSLALRRHSQANAALVHEGQLIKQWLASLYESEKEMSEAQK